MPAAGASTPLDVRIDLKRYRRGDGTVVEAVRGLTLAIAPARFTCLIGPSGCGKTTALRIAAGLDHDFEGAVTPDPRSLRLALMFQEPRLLPWRTVEQNVRLVLARPERRKPLDSLFAAVGLESWRDRYPGELSLGLARRVALARALATEPDFLLLDEPFVSLDDSAAAALRGVLLEAFAARGMGILMVTHNLREALAIADTLVLLAPRPSRVLARVDLDAPRPSRSGTWIETERRSLAERFPSVVARG
ncbi:ABC transporter ATP-binding protein [Segnochrobactrum spirostomi]|uniref:ATP-binding cassette domain-containing protein n=1 Tax=Segnochrobactrum spirostomi TaxID=2608987 RepID=A0A6A7Y884_9HYPH|nr:ATP-binding cassette domain-containing protein [Segnochrobactrum spirostomi]MQT15564.1 ATP-binding cassette domain-containing protein [Segnochrobactrum spirostomi]